MKRLIYILLLGVVVACSKEDALTPTEVKNWYVIVPTENMDEVDEMIYNLYEKYGKAIFYKDTIGSEDRGWKDENGDPKLYYEVLRLGYDMTEEVNIQTRITYNLVDVSAPENKAAMLPLLKLMDEKLLAWIDGANVFVPAILVVNDMVRSKKPLYVYRGFGVLGFALNGFEEPNADSLFQRTFLHEVCYGALQETLSAFHTVVTDALEGGTSASPALAKECWGVNYEVFVPSYGNWVSSINSMQSYMDMKIMYQAKKDVALEWLERDDLPEAERKKWENEVSLANNIIAAMDKQLNNYDEYKTNLEQYCPENFGLLSLTISKIDGKTYYYVPTAEKDFADYLDALLDYDEEEFKEKYADYPYVQARYTLMKHVLSEAGFDIERIKSDLK